jgi:hypothetical protein
MWERMGVESVWSAFPRRATTTHGTLCQWFTLAFDAVGSSSRAHVCRSLVCCSPPLVRRCRVRVSTPPHCLTQNHPLADKGNRRNPAGSSSSSSAQPHLSASSSSTIAIPTSPDGLDGSTLSPKGERQVDPLVASLSFTLNPPFPGIERLSPCISRCVLISMSLLHT